MNYLLFLGKRKTNVKYGVRSGLQMFYYSFEVSIIKIEYCFDKKVLIMTIGPVFERKLYSE